MINYKYILLFVISLYCAAARADSKEKLHKKAQKYLYSESLKEALGSYQEILQLDGQDALAQYRVEICSLILYPSQTSIEKLIEYRGTEGKKDKFYNYWLGRAYFHQQQFRKAIETWQKFLAMDKYKSVEIIAETEYRIAWAERAEEQYSHAENYRVEQLPSPINTSDTQINPVFISESDELLFFSRKENSIEEERYQIFSTTRMEENWSEPVLIKELGDFLSQNVGLEWEEKSGTLYFYKGEKKGELFKSRQLSDRWGELLTMGEEIAKVRPNPPIYINADETRMLFSLRKKGNSVDLDLFESRKEEGSDKWSKPELISLNLTTDLDEDFPYLTPDGNTLYFSSKGFNSIGGYDVFKSEYDESTQTWSDPQSLGYPVNSIDDDIQFKIDPDTNSGYLASNRLSTIGHFDIYFFFKSDKVLLSGEIFDSAERPAGKAEVHFYPIGDNTMEPLKTMTDANGMYEVKVPSDDSIKIEVYFNNELVHTELIKTPAGRGAALAMQRNITIGREMVAQTDDADEQEDPDYAEVEDIGSKFRVSNKALLSNIYFGFGDYGLDDQDKLQLKPLVTVMKENPKLRVEIAGHTDNIGDGKANLRISILRASAVANYLVSQGIASDRVEPRGYGYAIPMASNDQEREGREFNRRIEVLVLE